MTKFTRQIKDFSKGMTPDVYDQNGIVKIEHFDLTTPIARPYRTLEAGDGDIIATATNFSNVCKGNYIYGLCQRSASVNAPQTMYWNSTTKSWVGDAYIGTTSAYKEALIYYSGYLYGLSASYLWQATVGSSINATFKALPATCTTFTDFLIHSKDGYLYWGSNNLILRFDGTNLVTGFTFPANFVITSISEQGDYISAVGYDSITGFATYNVWDRDTSNTTLFDKAELGYCVPIHNATLGGVPFIISYRPRVNNFDFSETTEILIRYISGGRVLPLNEYPYTFLVMGGKQCEYNKLYFHAQYYSILFDSGETSPGQAIFCLDDKGRLSIAQNLTALNSDIGATGINFLRSGSGFWIAGGSALGYNTAATYSSEAVIETPKYRSDKLNMNIDLIGATVSFEPLASGASVVIKTRADDEITWTTLATFDTDDSVKGSITGQGLSTAKERQFQIISTGAAITGFEASFEDKGDETYD